MEEYHEAYIEGLNDGIRTENERVRKRINERIKQLDEERIKYSYEKSDYADSRYRELIEILAVIGEIE